MAVDRQCNCAIAAIFKLDMTEELFLDSLSERVRVIVLGIFLSWGYKPYAIRSWKTSRID